jgi:anti-sigma B factor antagonist
MKFSVEETDGIRIVSSLPKVLDANNAMDFKADMARTLEGSTRVIFDMSAVKFIDSAGCGALITVLRQLKESGGDLKLYEVEKQVRMVFELVRMHKIIDIFNTRQEAILAFSHGQA